MHIVIAGNIGSGKSTLTRLLSQHYGWTPRYESVDHNPYLEDYYRDIHRWSFNLEVYFLKERFRDMLAIAQTPGTIIQDRSIFEGVYVFMANNKAMGHLSDRDYRTYMELFEHEDFINNQYKGRVMIVDKDNLDFENRREDFSSITSRIDKLLYGLFPIEN